MPTEIYAPHMTIAPDASEEEILDISGLMFLINQDPFGANDVIQGFKTVAQIVAEARSIGPEVSDSEYRSSLVRSLAVVLGSNTILRMTYDALTTKRIQGLGHPQLVISR